MTVREADINRTGVICIIVDLAVGISNLFYIFTPLIIIFAAFAIASGVLIIFIEIPLLLRICPTSEKFDIFMRRFTTNYMRAGFYLVLSIIQWVSLAVGHATSLVAAAVLMLIASIFYLAAGVKGHEFAGSKTLGGQGVAQMII